MKEIPLSQGYVAIVDDERYEDLMRYKWYVLRVPRGPFAQRHGSIAADGKQPTILMHRQITDAPPGMQVDHRNHNTLDNQDANLRVCTQSQNNANQRKTRGTSRFKGVCWHKRDRKWHARMGKNGHKHDLGYFDDEREAARAYNVAALEHFGEFALLNELD